MNIGPCARCGAIADRGPRHRCEPCALVADGGTQVTVPEGWVRQEVIAGMKTVGLSDTFDQYLGMGSGYKCESCAHYIPIESLEDDTCPSCDGSGMIGTVIMGRQEITALYPEGWFDE